MRVAAFTEFTGPESVSIQRFDDPDPASGEVVIDVDACGLNHHDLVILEEGFGVTEEMLPFVSGVDVAGVVDEVGSDVDVEPGARVLLSPHRTCGACRYCREGAENLCQEMDLYHGGLAERALVDVDRVAQGRLIPLPDDVSTVEAAALPGSYMTTWHMIQQANVTAGDLVLIPGATGGVGVAAIQLLELLGARSIGTSRSRKKLDRASEFGLDHSIHSGDPDEIEEAVLTIGSPDVVLNHLGGPYTDLGVRVLRPDGTMVICGFTASRTSEIDIPELFGPQKRILGVTSGTQSHLERVVELVDNGAFTPAIDRTYDLEETEQAFRDLADGDVVGKLIVTPT